MIPIQDHDFVLCNLYTSSEVVGSVAPQLFGSNRGTLDGFSFDANQLYVHLKSTLVNSTLIFPAPSFGNGWVPPA